MATKTPPPPPPPLFSAEELLEFETKPNAVTAEDTATKGARRNYNFPRIWSDEDEIVMLKGLIDYRSKTKSANLRSFHDFIKTKLDVDVTSIQLRRKILSMKNKYANNKSRMRKFSKSQSHDQKTYDLSEMVWGNTSGRGDIVLRPRANRKVKPVAEDVKKIAAAVVENGKGNKLAGEERVMSMEERMLTAGREMYELGKDREEEWQKLRVEELELYQKEMEVKAAKMKVRIQQTKLVLDGIKGGGNLTLF